jgi:hypothetical protein
MNQLVLRDKAQEFMLRFLGGLLLLSVGLQLFIHSPKKTIFWILVVVFILAAILFFTLMFGALINRITADAGILTIRWNTRVFKKHIRIDQITEITEDKRFIYIMQQEGRRFRLIVKYLNPDKRRAVRKFLKEVTGF